jgi:replication factor C subunit 3/5
MFYGPSGAGKKTRILALLRAIFGPGAERVRLEHRTFKTPSNKSVEITTVASNYHIEICPGDAGIYDRIVVQEVIKEIASSQSIATSFQNSAGEASAAGGKGLAKPAFKVVLLTGVDRLTKQAQSALRRTMERYTSACRLILCCNSSSKVIEPVRSRCLGVRVPAPAEDDMCSVLQSVCKSECIQLPSELAMRIAKVKCMPLSARLCRTLHADGSSLHSQGSGRNMRKAILMLEACKVQKCPLSADQNVTAADWEMYIDKVADKVVMEQSPVALMEVRDMLYELLTNCIPPDEIIRKLVKCLILKIPFGEVKHEIVHWGAHYEHRMHMGSKEIFHLEAFLAKVMAIYKKSCVDFFELN